MKESNRMNKINEEIKKEVSSIINFELNNTNITGLISVTKVSVTPDMRYARIFISVINSKNKKNTLTGLKKASGFIRSTLAKKINMRYTPELVFEFDETMEYGARIDSIIDKISKELKENMKNEDIDEIEDFKEDK